MKIRDHLNESSLSRVWKRMQKHDSGTITAFRNEYTKGQNKARNRTLLAKLMMKNYSVTKVKGTYIENFKTPEAKEVGENVFLVIDIKDKGDLKSFLVKLGEEFEQDSILFVLKGGGNGLLIGTNNSKFPGYHNKISLKNPIFGEDGEFFTRVNGRPFMLKEESDDVIYPNSIMGKWSMSAMSKSDWKEFYNHNKTLLEGD